MAVSTAVAETSKMISRTDPVIPQFDKADASLWLPTNFFAIKFGLFRFYAYICTVKAKDLYMSKETMIQQIAHYFETQPVLKAWLFGSYSRDEQKDGSDVDILVKFDRSIPIGLFAYLRMHRELEEKLGCKVDLVEEGTLRPSVQSTANRDLKVIYERNN